VVLAPAERHAVPAREVLESALVVKLQGLLDGLAEGGEFGRAERVDVLADLQPDRRGVGRRPCGDGHLAAPLADDERE